MDVKLTADEVDSIEQTRQLVVQLQDYADNNDDAPLDRANLVLLEEQLNALHQAMSVVVAQKQQYETVTEE